MVLSNKLRRGAINDRTKRIYYHNMKHNQINTCENKEFKDKLNKSDLLYSGSVRLHETPLWILQNQ